MVPTTGPGAPARHGARTDTQFRLFATSRPHGVGWGGEVALASSTWGADSTLPDQGVHQASASFRYSDPRATLSLTGRLADRRTTAWLGSQLGLVAAPGVILSGEASLARVDHGRTARRAWGTLGLYRGPLSLVGDLAWQDSPQAPALPQDTARVTADRAVRVGLDTRVLSGHAAAVRRDAYAPLAFPDVPIIPAFAPSTPSTSFVADAKLQPIPSLAIDGWYANPIRGHADFQPPTHGRAQITFRSKFWRTFRSGAFDLKVQIAMESWSRGTAGLAADGSPIGLNGITFYEAFLSFQIVGFTAFWDLRNAYNSREQYVPGLPYPKNAQTFGVRWEFFN